MTVIQEGRLKGSIKGFKNCNTVFTFINGRKWKQNRYKYHYHYAYMPTAKVVSEGSRYYLQIKIMNDQVEVKRL